MTWQNLYLFCFALGFLLTVVALFGGALHLPHHAGGHAGHSSGHASGSHAPGGPGVSSVPPLNFATAMAFLAWFGGMGYLLTGHSRLGSAAILAIATATGLGGGALVLGFLTRAFLSGERPLDPADFQMVGVLATVTVPIREGGTGEITFPQQGTRRCSGARSEAGTAIARGREVVVTGYEKGIAYVRSFDELTSETNAISRGQASLRETMERREGTA